MTEMSPFAHAIMEQKYSHTKADGSKETWDEIAARVAKAVTEHVGDAVFTSRVQRAIAERKFMPGGRYLYAAGRDFHQTQNCLLLRAEDSREGWAALMHKSAMALMTGAGIGVDYSAVRPKDSIIRRTGGLATGPCALMQMVNEAGRHIMQGGARRSAIWAGLDWKHQDIFAFIDLKNWPEDMKRMKERDFNAPATLDGTNISVGLDEEFFIAYSDKIHPRHQHAQSVYWQVIRQMLKTAEPGFSVNCANSRESLRNACTEVTSEDDSDICNLGSVNLARIKDLEELREIVELGTKFLLAGTVYSHVPYDQVATIRTKNRRLGLGLLGVHEWLLQRGLSYNRCYQLAEWLGVYRDHSDTTAYQTADEWDLSCPVAVRAIAPTGTIGIVAETTTGIEPLFCVAYRRRYKGPDGHSTQYQYVIDPCAKRLIDAGVDPSTIEDAYQLAERVEQRVEMQAWLQQFVDQGISSTINLPAWGSEFNNEHTLQGFGDMLFRHLPYLRGITAYPDGARGGQPLSPVKYETAIKHVGQVFYEQADVCDIAKSGSC